MHKRISTSTLCGGQVLVDIGVEEQRVNAPRERLCTPVHVVIRRRLREHSAVLLLDVLDVGMVLNFGVIYPSNADNDSWDTGVVTNFSPEIRCLSGVVGKSLVGLV